MTSRMSVAGCDPLTWVLKRSVRDVAVVCGNTTIPVRKSEIFSTAMDNQTAVDIKV